MTLRVSASTLIRPTLTSSIGGVVEGGGTWPCASRKRRSISAAGAVVTRTSSTCHPLSTSLRPRSVTTARMACALASRRKLRQIARAATRSARASTRRMGAPRRGRSMDVDPTRTRGPSNFSAGRTSSAMSSLLVTKTISFIGGLHSAGGDPDWTDRMSWARIGVRRNLHASRRDLATQYRRARSVRPDLGRTGSSLAETCGQPAQQLAAADGVEDEDRQCRQDDRGEDGGNVDAVLPLERPQRQRQGSPARALGEDQWKQEAVPNREAVVNGHGDQRRARQRKREAPQRGPLAGPVDPHRLEELLGHIADEVRQDQHRQRDGERDLRQDDRQEAVVQLQTDDDQVDGDDGRLQRNRQSHQEESVDRLQEPAAAADDGERGHERDEDSRDDRTRGHDDAVDEVLREVRLDDEPVVVNRRGGRRLERVHRVVVGLRLEARDDDPVDRHHDDHEPDPAGQPAQPVRATTCLLYTSDAADEED